MQKKVKLENLRQARRLSARIINNLLAGEIDPNTSSAIFKGLTVFKSLYEMESIEARLTALEQQAEAQCPS